MLYNVDHSKIKCKTGVNENGTEFNFYTWITTLI